MAQFLTKLVVSKENGGTGRWILEEHFAYKSDLLPYSIVVPQGYSTDFASVPRVPVAYFLVGNTADEPAVIHDYLYSNHDVVGGRKSLADSIFLEAMRVVNDPKEDWKRRIMYRSVQWLGWLAWRRGGKNSKKK